MREIKFRYRIKAPNGHIETKIFSLEEVEAGKIWSYTSTSYSILSRDLFIGLKDKNGKEGYSGDICKDKRGRIYEIVWDEKGWRKNYQKGQYSIPLSFPLSRFGEDKIIGNIHENKNLLEEYNDNRT